MYGDLEIDYSLEVWYGLGEIEELDPEEGEYDNYRARVARRTKSYPRNFGGSERNDQSTRSKSKGTRRKNYTTYSTHR